MATMRRLSSPTQPPQAVEMARSPRGASGPLLKLQESRRSRSPSPSRLATKGRPPANPTPAPARERKETDGGPLLHTEQTHPDVQVQAHPKGEVPAGEEARNTRLVEIAESQRFSVTEKQKKAEEESTGNCTHLVVHGARLVFLFSHSLVVLLASMSLETMLKGDHLTTVGALTCDLGATPSEDACQSTGEAVVTALGQTVGQEFTPGEYVSSPSGCLVASGSDYRVVYNRHQGGPGNSEFAVVCAVEVASWFELFIPIYIGNLACIGLLVWSVFASCKYIRRTQKAGKVRVGNYPSLLTDLLPEIGLSMLGVVVMLIICAGEWTLMRYLSTENVHRLIESTVFLTIVCLLGTCHGVLLTHNSLLYLSLAASVFLSLVIHLFVRSSTAQAQAWTLLPWVAAVSIVTLASARRLCYHWKLLSCEERLLRFLESAALAVCVWGLGSMGRKMHEDRFQEAGNEGVAIGGCMCFIVLLRARLSLYWELRRGTLDARVIDDMAVPGEGIYEDFDEEFQQDIPLETLGAAEHGPSVPGTGQAPADKVTSQQSPQSPTVMTV